MRNIAFALLTAFALAGAAQAADSTPVDYDHATLTVMASGAYGEAVNFTVPSTTVQLGSGLLRPGATYTVSIPVTNTTDRPITVSVTNAVVGGTGAGLVTLTGGTTSAVVAPNAVGTLTYTVSLDPTLSPAATSSKTVSIEFNLEGAAVN